MRPINRGSCPEESGQACPYKKYTEARGELIKRLGEYCSYCEMHLDSGLAVEHMQPKKPDGTTVIDSLRLLDWNNFLLACPNCNATKSNENVVLDDYLWPDRDNTFRAFCYSEGGLVSYAHDIGDNQLRQKACKMIHLVGLDKIPTDHDIATEASDRRWLNRKEAWEIAIRSKERLSRNDNEDFREQVLETPKAKGFWSIWMTVFKDDADMLQRLIEAFPGTCTNCFNEQYIPVPRQGGQC
jgi:uncharacterized protein (TIGR02646 family)